MSDKTSSPLKFWNSKSDQLAAKFTELTGDIQVDGKTEKEIRNLICQGAAPPGGGNWAAAIINELRDQKPALLSYHWLYHCVNCNKCDFLSCTRKSTIIESNLRPTVKRLVSYRDETTGSTLLHYAAGSRKDKIVHRVVEYLLSCGAKASAFDRNGQTPLHVAAASDDTAWVVYQIVWSLKEHNDSTTIDAEDNLSRTPLHVALAHGAKKAAKALTFGEDRYHYGRPRSEPRCDTRKPRNLKLWDLAVLPGRLEAGVSVSDPDALGNYRDVCALLDEIRKEQEAKIQEWERNEKISVERAEARKKEREEKDAAEKKEREEAKRKAQRVHCCCCKCDQ